MAHTYRKLIESGNCRVAYVFHVMGYPWAVCTDSDIVKLIEPGTSKANFLRNRMFGKVHNEAYYPSDHVVIVPTLDPMLGVQTITTKTIGLPEISGWSVNIFDESHYADWSFYTDDSFRGLDGLHRIATHLDYGRRWGFLGDNITAEGGQVPVNEHTDGSDTLYNAIDETNTVKYLWINHECIAVNDVTGTFPRYNAEIVMRGCFKSRRQYHLKEQLGSFEPMISDVPSSIAGHFANLWAIPLDANGECFYDDNNKPVIGLERYGVVSPDIQTIYGVTTVTLTSGLDTLKNNIDYGTTDKTESHLAKFFFCRGDSGTDWYDIYSKGQKPHMYIAEFRATNIPEYMLDPDASVGLAYANGIWQWHPIWLCEKNSTVSFNSAEELVAAINQELKYLETGDVNQKTGNGEDKNARVRLLGKYEIKKTAPLVVYEALPFGSNNSSGSSDFPMWYMHQLTRTPFHWMQLGFPSTYLYHGKYSQVGGICQVLLGLGVPFSVFDDTMYKQPVYYRSYHRNSKLDWFYMRGSLWSNGEGWLHTQIKDQNFDVYPITTTEKKSKMDNRVMWLPEIYTNQELFWNSEYDGLLTVNHYSHSVPCDSGREAAFVDFHSKNYPTDFFVAKYFYQWDWRAAPLYQGLQSYTEARIDVDLTPHVRKAGFAHTGNLHTYDLDAPLKYPVGVTIGIGPHYGSVTTHENIVIDNNRRLDKITVDSLSTEPRAYYGSCLIDVPAYSLDMSDASEEEKADATLRSSSSTYVDPFAIRLKRSDTANRPIDIIKAFLGYSSSIIIPPQEKRLHEPFFRDDTLDDTLYSIINWNSLGELTEWTECDFGVSIPTKSFRLYDFVDTLMQMFGLSSYFLWNDSRGQMQIEFRKFGEINSSNLAIINRSIGTDVIIPGGVSEDHFDSKIYNAISLEYTGVDGSKNSFRISNSDVFSVIQRPLTELKIEPVFYTFGPIVDNKDAFTEHFMDILLRLGSIKPTYSRRLTYASKFRVTPGFEISVTDPSAHYPNTHDLGLVAATALVTRYRTNLSDSTIDIDCNVSGDYEYHGIAPSCRIDLTAISRGPNNTYFDCTPEDHYGHSTIKDIYFFDCFDLSDIDNPEPKGCNCNNYKCNLFIQDTGVIIPAQVIVSGSTMRVICDPGASVPETGTAILSYREFGVVEPCQKLWIYYADSNGRVGTTRKGDFWS